MKIINWNISWLKDTNKKIEYLKEHVEGHSFIMILQEVKQYSYELIKTAFNNIACVEYSLEYRVPGKYDTDSRKLGVAILVSKDIKIKNVRVLDRAIMPDRTLMVDVEYDGLPLRVLGLHSITGCHHLKAKEIQYFSFAEAIDNYKPDIVGIDANEPKKDHYEIEKMEFFDNYNKGKGCQTFFTCMKEISLVDAFVKNYDKNKYIEGEYLSTSHIIKRGKKKVRYDFLFLNQNLFRSYTCEYDYHQAIEAGSDHAAILLTL